jgi:hypothetical protein
MTIFLAREELQSTTGLSDVELSREFAKLSVGLFLDNPGLYLRSVGKAWFSFWAVPNYWNLENFRTPALARAVESVWQVEKWLLRIGYLAFVIIALPTLWIAWVRKRGVDRGWHWTAVLVGIVLSASLLQALLEYGENPRYAIPTQSIAMAALVMFLFLGPRLARKAPSLR